MTIIYQNKDGLDVTQTVRSNFLRENMDEQSTTVLLANLLKILADPETDQAQLQDWLYLTFLLFSYDGDILYSSQDPATVIVQFNELADDIRHV